jgi:predicted enzyme related to lactoylglutathione lyase
MRVGMYVAVADMQRALAFYRALFRVDPSFESDRYSAFEVNGTRFGLFNRACYAHPLVIGNNCIPNIEVDDVDAEYVRVRPLVATITDGVQTAGPYRLFMLADPEGNVLEFFSGPSPLAPLDR